MHFVTPVTLTRNFVERVEMNFNSLNHPIFHHYLLYIKKARSFVDMSSLQQGGVTLQGRRRGWQIQNK